MSGPDLGRPCATNLYRVLGVEPDAGSAQIARAYRQLARRYHPDIDTTPGAADRFARITRAYRVLSDPRARARYDADLARRRSATTASTGAANVTRSSWETASSWSTADVRRTTSGPATFRLGTPVAADAFHLGEDHRARPLADEEAELDLSLEEACCGTSRTVTVTTRESTETIRVSIPPGMIDGERIQVPTTRLPGGRKTAPVVLRVQLLPDEPYEVDGRNIHLTLPLSPWEAALGGTVTVDTPRGPGMIDVPAHTSTGRLLTLTGRGIPNPDGPPGDLYAHAHIVLPDQLTPSERDLFQRLAATSTFNPRTSAKPQP